ncbi:MAG: hypothetical protein AAGD32_13285 [Planctomycetota bacterium]
MLQATRVMIASKNGREAKAITALMRQIGYEPRSVAPEQAMREARTDPPDILLLDGELPRTAMDTTLRILARHPDCRATVILLLGPPDGDKMALQRLRMLDAYNVLPRPLGSETLVTVLREAADWAADLRATFGIRHRNQAAGATRHVEGCNSLLVRDVACYFHETPQPTQRFMLRSGKVRADVNLFDVPVYESSVAGADFVDFNRIETIVCPTCGFASNDPGWFVDLKEADAQDPAPANIVDAAALSAIEAATEERLELLGKPDRLFWSHERSADQAILALRLSIASGITLYNANPERSARVAFNVANDYLRLAVLQEQADEPTGESFAQAQRWLLDAYNHLEGPRLTKAMYQLLALGLRSDNPKSGYEYLKQLDCLQRKSAGSDRTFAERYLNRAKNIWSDRDYLQAA